MTIQELEDFLKDNQVYEPADIIVIERWGTTSRILDLKEVRWNEGNGTLYFEVKHQLTVTYPVGTNSVSE